MKIRSAIRFSVPFGPWFRASLAAQPAKANETLKLLPPYGQLPPTFRDQHGTTILVVALGAGLVIAWVAWRLWRPKPPAPIAPETQARKALNSQLHCPENGETLSRISRILRRYFIVAFELPSGEPTTSEFHGELAAHATVGGELSQAVGDFLRRCDERKFSPHPPAEPPGAARRALELVALGEARRAELKRAAPGQSQPPPPPTA